MYPQISAHPERESAESAQWSERLDRLRIGGMPVELPVMGRFEVDADGKLTTWRDSFDMAQLTSQMS